MSKTFGASLSSSMFHTAEAYDFPHFDIGINLLSVAIPSSARQDSNSHVTVFGNYINDSTKISGLNMSNFQLPVLQLNFGLGDNTNILLRYTRWNDSKLGDINVFGAGIKYELENLFSISPIPFNIGILAFYQKYKVDKYIEGAAFDMHLIFSKHFRIIPLELYASGGYLNNTTNIQNPNDRAGSSTSVEGLENIRYQAGMNFSVFIINVNAEYSFGEYSTVSLGVRVSL
ncbi:MAG: hypothetical protein KDF60_11130 [Calditrichaeota bacterium]|nr:hypothetical protein [Calditrichota bacterium]